MPPVPPNTAQHSAIPSQPQTPSTHCSSEEDESEAPVEIRVKGVLADSSKPYSTDHTRAATPIGYFLAPPRSNSLPASPSIPRQLSNLPFEELQFLSHRDSVEIARGHMRRELLDRQHRERPNSLLLATRDSYGLTKNKFDTIHPATAAPEAHGYLTPTIPSIQWTRFGGLSPIADGSPPNEGIWRLGKQNGTSPLGSSPRLSPRSRVGSPAGSDQVSGSGSLQERVEHLEERMRILEDRLISVEEGRRLSNGDGGEAW